MEEVVKMGLEKWVQRQLQADFPNSALEQRLAKYETLRMSNAQIVQTFPKQGQVLKMAIREGLIDKDAVRKDAADKISKQEYQAKLESYMQQKGFKPQRILYQEMVNQKILRATYSENQLQEILTSFWFNHFNVSLTNKNCDLYLTSYERDVIRPNALGKFETLLLATAKSPAMLTYLDNFKSTSSNADLTPAQKQRQERQIQLLERRQEQDNTMQQMQVAEKVRRAKKAQGLNENYAREIMELHTLGVDGGYTQQDVTQAAHIMTGWTINPAIDGYRLDNAPAAINNPKRTEALQKQGFVQEGDFLFAANRHDKGRKEVLGTTFPPQGGYEEGLQLIKLLAHHPSTAKFISTKLATRFVSDTPPRSLIDKMAKTFTEKDGDIREVLMTMVAAPEFWSKEALREKTKSPFELAISSVRSLNAEVHEPRHLATWITKMGEKIYSYQAPTGFPDKGTYWINTGSLLNRMNFGLALASQKIKGISFDLVALNQNREPESAEAALITYSQFLMPERNLEATIKRLTPSLNDPEFGFKVNAAAHKNQAVAQKEPQEQEEQMMLDQPKKRDAEKNTSVANTTFHQKGGNSPMLAQIVGIIIGSPEFQRR
ncbi:DUF1800 domain-containing protein [Rufibacter tibetensis]|uniref:DUF1800 domain-containing protein n=1 Tax=Rufibacter tibetensis TaxID=512763 RepID=UPI001FDFB7E7